jgi:hypothetical protein
MPVPLLPRATDGVGDRDGEDGPKLCRAAACHLEGLIPPDFTEAVIGDRHVDADVIERRTSVLHARRLVRKGDCFGDNLLK